MKGLVFSLLVLMAAPAAGDEGPKVTGLSLDAAPCDRPAALTIRGERLKSGKTLRVQLWQGNPSRLIRGVSLVDVEGTRDALRATLPPGALPGVYHLVVITKSGTDFSDHVFEVREPEAEATQVTSMESFLMTAGWEMPAISQGSTPVLPDHPTRVALAGAHLDRVEEVWLEGPDKVVLRNLTAQHTCRLLATVPGDLRPGDYRLSLRAEGRTMEAPGTIAVLTEGPGEAGAVFLILFSVLGFFFVVGLALAWRAGQVGLKTAVARRNLALQVGGLILYFLLLGFFQFVMSDWIG